MPEPRDRLARAIDIASVYTQRRSGIFQELETGSPPMITRPNPVNRTGREVGLSPGGRGGRGNFGTPRNHSIVRGRHLYGTMSRNGTRNGSGSVLPSWYPRTPLRDITAIVRAIERRRERLGDGRVQEIESPVPHAYVVPDSSEPSVDAHLEQSNTRKSPISSLQVKRCPPTVGKVPKILLDITNKASDDSEFLTPQKKLLNSIDTVEKEVMEELRKLKRTASAKKAEREKKVRTLMSLR